MSAVMELTFRKKSTINNKQRKGANYRVRQKVMLLKKKKKEKSKSSQD